MKLFLKQTSGILNYHVLQFGRYVARSWHVETIHVKLVVMPEHVENAPDLGNVLAHVVKQVCDSTVYYSYL